MTLDVTCDVAIEGNDKALNEIRETLREVIEAAIAKSELTAENYEILQNNSDLIQVFFTTRYQPPITAIKNLAAAFENLTFCLTFDDQNGNSGRIQFEGETEKNLEYKSEFQQNLDQLIAEGELPPYGIIAIGKDEDDLNSIILRYAEERGYESSGEDDEDEAGFAIDWLVEEIGQDFGCFDTEDLNFIFRPWQADEL